MVAIDGNKLYKDVNLTSYITDIIHTLDGYDYINEGTLYKHVFHKNSDGTYYWYSSEPIE